MTDTESSGGDASMNGGPGPVPHDPIPSRFTPDEPGFMSARDWLRWEKLVALKSRGLESSWASVDFPYQVDMVQFRDGAKADPPVDRREVDFENQVRAIRLEIWLTVCAHRHIRALLAENLQLRQDCEQQRNELEPLRQRYEILKKDTAEYIAKKERRDNEEVALRLGQRPKRAWWRKLLGR